jgi:serpin B
MATVLHYTLPQERLHPAFNALDLQLAAPPAASGDEQPFQLSIANSLWGQDGYQFLPEFLDLLAMHYGAGMRLLDFKSDPNAARQLINRWVEEQTKERIKDLIPEGGLDPSARLVLANAIYFKADWLYSFEPGNTRPMPFHRLDGSQIDAPMMTFEHAQDLRYAEGDGYQAVELPYQGGQTSMLLLVPESGRFEEFEAGLDAARLQQIVDGLQTQTVGLLLPKFEFTQEYALADTLLDMGMPEAFCDAGAEIDFSGMDGTRNLCIGQVFHKAFVAVDEKGTEAAAASAVVMLEAAMVIQDVKEVIVDRPFIFVIRDNSSDSLLFVGRVLDPAL